MSPPADGSLFDDDWLTLREPVDHASRAHGLAEQAARWLARYALPTVVDLGTGSGSNLRYLAPYLGPDTRWRLVDHDEKLLARVASRSGQAINQTVATEARDLAHELPAAIAGGDLITASALLDLVSQAWLTRLCAQAATQRSAVLMTLSVDGHIRFDGQTEADDAALLAALARDQRRDKGLGMALGTAAPAALINELARHGYAVTAQPAVWHLGPQRAALAHALLTGWARAAGAALPEHAERFTAWATRRSADVAAGRTVIRVGHVDVLGLPGRDFGG
ncbi:class I SAM-dependent methyltransferase [uncultured Salinisphaera sp.]|uniref:class I SAM-dependent methyltransferase n=1 Tax=uncultured Salinisphaera sp. TaxID=359372 RepID=UPI0032B1AFD2|tara:strand:- start:3240 stop:4076 length:837 start_codon:yes stop_codon:yes gene_type:complete